MHDEIGVAADGRGEVAVRRARRAPSGRGCAGRSAPASAPAGRATGTRSGRGPTGRRTRQRARRSPPPARRPPAARASSAPAASARRGRRASPAGARPPAGRAARARGRAPRGASTTSSSPTTSFARIISSSTSTCACASDSSHASATPPSPSKRNASSGVCTCNAPRANLAARHSVARRSFSSRDVEHRGRRLAALGLAVGEPRIRPDDGAVEERRAAGRQLDRHAEAILVRAQRAEVVGQVVRQHRRDGSRHVGRERALHRAVVERRAGADEVRHVGDVHPGADPLRLLAGTRARRRSPSPYPGRRCT